MIDENFYQKKVDELKRSLQSTTVFINESFSGGLFRTSAKPFLSQLSIYHLLRGLEINTDEETYGKLQSMSNIKDVFISKDKAENIFTVEIVKKELGYIKEQLEKLQTEISDKVSDFIKGSKEDISIPSSLINSLKDNKTIFNTYLDKLSVTISTNETGLEVDVYKKIDAMDLNKLNPENFKTGAFLWLDEKIDERIDAKLNDNNPIVRISMFLELVLKTMNIDGLKFISSESPYDYLVSIIGYIQPTITPRKLEKYKGIIDTISQDIFQNQKDLIQSQHKVITIPTLQSLFISLITVVILKAISSVSVEAVKGEEKVEKPKSLLSEKVQVKAKGIITAFDELDKLGFFKSEKVFYEKPRKEYTIEEGKMIVQLKKLFKEMGFINESAAYMISRRFDSQTLGSAVKDFQSYVKFNDKPLTADGRIGKTTRLVLATFVEDLKKRNQGEPVQAKAQTVEPKK